ncbi:uncharacterized protein C2orf42 homolog [Anopheles albimanus]|uniref:Putative treble-clef zinc-finger domain-containing protein n=1 Tax=Anopheles albimanus TaxID=7167 RepID=A0A8W7JCK7_ANOAL|nr:uncharacterized protein C2orf42 homolog [Anopheles albimanus]
MSFLLGSRSSYRGLRKCPKCGQHSGNRATKCKNASCDQVFRFEDGPGKRHGSASTVPASFAVRLLHPAADSRLYSVSLGPGNRFFVESLNEPDGRVSLRSLGSSTIPSSVTELVRKLILESNSVAEPLPIHRDALDTLATTDVDKQSIWDRQTQCSPAALVQRLSGDLFVVGHPYFAGDSGTLWHLKATKRNQKYSQLTCDCCTAVPNREPSACWHVLAIVAALLSAPQKYPDRQWGSLLREYANSRVSDQRPSVPADTTNPILSIEYPLSSAQLQTLTECIAIEAESNVELIDFHDSLVATSSRPPTFEAFPEEGCEGGGLIMPDLLDSGESIYELAITDDPIPPSSLENDCSSDVFATSIEESDLALIQDCQIELMDQFDLTDRIDFCPSDIECDESLLLAIPSNVIESPSDDSCSAMAADLQREDVSKRAKGKKPPLVEITTKKSALRQMSRLPKDKLTRGSYSLRKLMRTLESNGILFNRISGTGATTVPLDAPSYEASLCNLSFIRWLEAVIEQLNSVIEYSSDGRPGPQTFRIQEDFFRCLRARFSIGHHLRQPDAVQPQPETPASQLFKFTHHNSLLHVFRTERIALCFEKHFTRSASGHFTAIDIEDPPGMADATVSGTGRPIRPQLYSTFIKLGRYKHEADQDRVYHLGLEWIGGLLPRSGFGELRITFEFGHRAHGRYVPPPIS